MDTTHYEFIRWGTPHLCALAATLLCATTVLGTGLRCSEQGRHLICRALAVVLALEFVGEYILRMLLDSYGPWKENLPLHFCSLMMIVSIIALWWRQRWACAFVYFGVLAASIQGLITPALSDGYPSITFFIFFLSHGLLLVAALAIPVLLGWRACGWDDLRTVLLADVYLLCIIPINIWLGTNYGFTQHGPEEGSMLDYLGPAPWYYLWLQLPALALFRFMMLLNSPRKAKTLAQGG